MCKCSTITADTLDLMENISDPFIHEGTFLVIRDLDAADVHVKGQFENLADAQARAAEFNQAAIVFVPLIPVGSTSSRDGRKVVEIDAYETVKVAENIPVLVF